LEYPQKYLKHDSVSFAAIQYRAFLALYILHENRKIKLLMPSLLIVLCHVQTTQPVLYSFLTVLYPVLIGLYPVLIGLYHSLLVRRKGEGESTQVVISTMPARKGAGAETNRPTIVFFLGPTKPLPSYD
jgi:hypothetical protein